MKNILLFKIILVIFLYSCHSQRNIIQMKNVILEKGSISLNIKLKDSLNQKYIEMIFINHGNRSIKISNPNCWINVRDITLKKVISTTMSEDVNKQVLIRIDPSCAIQFFVIGQQKTKTFIVPESFNKLYDTDSLKGSFTLHLNYLGTITDQNGNTLKKFNDKLTSDTINIFF